MNGCFVKPLNTENGAVDGGKDEEDDEKKFCFLMCHQMRPQVCGFGPGEICSCNCSKSPHVQCCLRDAKISVERRQYREFFIWCAKKILHLITLMIQISNESQTVPHKPINKVPFFHKSSINSCLLTVICQSPEHLGKRKIEQSWVTVNTKTVQNYVSKLLICPRLRHSLRES